MLGVSSNMAARTVIPLALMNGGGTARISKASSLPRCGPVKIKWPDASSAEKPERWLAYFRRKAWLTLAMKHS